MTKKIIDKTKLESKIEGFKGFDKNLKCRGFQYEIGKSYNCDSVSICETGFHFCEHPLDVFRYYNPANNRFAIVEGSGEIQRDNNDTKIACSSLTIKTEITMPALIQAAVDFTFSRCKKTIKGGLSRANSGAASATGDSGAASVEGKHSVAIVTGPHGKASGKKTCWIVLTERELIDNEWYIKCVKSVPVDGKKIKEDTFYMLKNGEIMAVD